MSPRSDGPRRRRGGRGAARAALLACLAIPLGAQGAEPAGPKFSAEGRKNLVPNGDFEKGGKAGPSNWQRLDGLTTSWEASPGRKGKCLRIDTDVLASQFRAREDEMEKARDEGREPSPPPPKAPTKEPKYDTVAGLDGVHFASDPIPIDPSKRYLLEAAIRVDGKGSPKVWVKAYARRKSRDVERERVVWKKALVADGAGKDWRTFRMVFPRDTALPAGVAEVRISLFPYWPPATYWFDDIRLVEVTEEEARKVAEEDGLLDRAKKNDG